MSINISQGNVAGPCNLKCAYSFQYPVSSCVATHYEGAISSSYDKSNSPPVNYNGNKYQVSGVGFYPGSGIFYFNQNQSDACLFIEHEAVLGGPPLVVGIPIKKSPSTIASTSILTEIINAVSSGAPNVGEKTTVNLSNYSLNHIVPNKPFYQLSVYDYDFIIFGIENAIPLSEETLNKLKTLATGAMSTSTFDPKNQSPAKIFYNKDGPSKEGSDIYIDCQPVNDSEDTVEVPVNKLDNANYSPADWFSELIHSVVFQSIIVCLVLFLLLYLLRMGINAIKTLG
jgi:hypothetical protein